LLGERRLVFPNIEPKDFPLDPFPRGPVKEIFIFPLGKNNQFSTTHLSGFARTWMRAETVKLLEKVKMWLDAKKRFTQMSQDRKIQNGLGGGVK